MNILLTGGTGFVGRALCDQLHLAGHDLWVLSRDVEKVANCCGKAVRGIGQLEEYPEDQVLDAVINLAGEPIADKRWTQAQKERLIQSRVDLTKRLVAFAARRKTGPRVLLSASAVGYYGDTGSRDVDESTPPANEFQHHLCRAWEEAALVAEEHGIRTCRVRIGIVLGRDGGALSKMLPAFRLGLGGPIGNGRQWMSWIHRSDLVRIFLFLLERETLSGAFNATAPNAVMNGQFARTLGAVLHRPAVLPVPGVALKLALGELSHLLLTGQKVIPRRLQESGFTFTFPELKPALESVVARND